MDEFVIKKYGRTDSIPISEIRELEKISNDHDGIKLNIYLGNDINVSGDLKSLFILFIGGKPVSALSMFVPTISEGEISGFTHPEYRRKGYFSKLLESAKEELKKFNVEKILLLVDSDSEPGLEYIKNRNGEYSFTEVLFRYVKVEDTPEDKPEFKSDTMKKKRFLDDTSYKVREITKEETRKMAKLSHLIFNRNYETSLAFAEKAFNAKNKTQYLLHLPHESIAMATTTVDDGIAYISGFGVKKEYQGMGIGKILMKEIINILLEKNIRIIELEADASNIMTMQFYSDCGFKANYYTHYYRIDF